MARMKGTIGFEEDIRPLFTESDRNCMFTILDLWDWRQVRDNATHIRSRLEEGSMPPGGWPSDKRQLFAAWVEEGAPKARAEKYSAFFRDLDSLTEYWDLYRPETNGKYFFGSGQQPGYLAQFWPSPQTPRAEAFERWREYAKFHRTPDGAELLEDLLQEIRRPPVMEALLAVDELVTQLVTEHFGRPDNTVDAEKYLDCVERYAIDALPPDEDRFRRVPDGDDRKPHSLYHTMDGAVMWFNWMAHIDCTTLVVGPDDPRRPLRALVTAGVAMGCPMDYVFRGPNRGRTRPEYQRDERTIQLLRSRAVRWSQDIDRAIAEGRDLYGIFAGIG